MRRAVIYARVFTTERGQDPETRLRPLREFAERRDFAVVGEYVASARADAPGSAPQIDEPGPFPQPLPPAPGGTRPAGRGHDPRERASMRAYKGDGFSDRLGTAADARKAALAKFRAKPGPDDPAARERQAARQAVAAAREVRQAAREAELARQAAEQAARDGEAARRAAEQAIRDAEEAAREVALEAERKKARDARYAARKARR